MKYSKEEKAGLLAGDGMIPTDDPKRIYSTYSEQKTYPVVDESKPEPEVIKR